MTTFVALIRGINVGSGNRIAMADLRATVADQGALDVRTLLQSGNIVFSGGGTAANWERRLAQALADRGLSVPVVVRTVDALAAAVDADPFGATATDPRKHLLAFFSAVPPTSAVAAVQDAVAQRKSKGGKDSDDEYRIVGDHAYLWCPVTVHESIFATVKWDKLLGVDVTMRNFDTVGKLLALARQ